jgi:hypothetical protein
MIVLLSINRVYSDCQIIKGALSLVSEVSMRYIAREYLRQVIDNDEPLNLAMVRDTNTEALLAYDSLDDDHRPEKVTEVIDVAL